MSVMDIFKSVQQVNTNPAMAPAATTTTPTTPAAVVTPPVVEKTPLDKVTELFQNDPNAKKGPDKNAPIFNVKQEDLLKAAGKIDFKSFIPAELQARVKAGGDDAIIANQEITNLIAQHVYATAAHASTTITEHAVKEATKRFEERIPEIVRQINLKSSVAEDNPLLSHPAIQPYVSNIQSQIQVKYPNASPSEMRAMVNESVLAMADAIVKANAEKNPPKPVKGSMPAAKEQDWSKFLE